jgi:putative tryptophan/tyrosine transport system substrate-binding protein
MNRRGFVAVVGGATAWPTIGLLGSSTPAAWSQWVAAFVQRLNELGWSEGRAVAIDYRWAEGCKEHYSEIATEFARLKVDVIVTAGSAAIDSLQLSRKRRAGGLMSYGPSSVDLLEPSLG